MSNSNQRQYQSMIVNPFIEEHKIKKSNRISLFNQNKPTQPQMINEINRQQNINNNVIQEDNDNCPKHQLKMTNISISRDIIEPLCPDCIEEHLHLLEQFNVTPQIKNINQIKKNCHDFIETIKTQYFNQQQILNQFSNENISQNIKMQQQVIVEARNQIVQFIDSYFDDLQITISQNIMSHSNQNPVELKKLQSKLDKLQSQLENQQYKLNSNNYLKTMLKILQNDMQDVYNQNLFSIQQELIKLEKGLQAIVINNEGDIFSELVSNLQQYCKIEDATKFVKQDQFDFQLINNNNTNEVVVNISKLKEGQQIINQNFSNIMNRYNTNRNYNKPQQIFESNYHNNNSQFRHNLDHLQIKLSDNKYDTNISHEVNSLNQSKYFKEVQNKLKTQNKASILKI